jgi:general secretion pathway protein C
MLRNSPSIWAPRLAAFSMAALLCASLVFWILRLQASAFTLGVVPPLQSASVAITQAIDKDVLAKVLGAEQRAIPASSPDENSAYRLVGVVAGGTGQGAALIAIDGQPPKAYKVGAIVKEGKVLQSVERSSAVLATQGQPSSTFKLDIQ